MRVVVKYLVSLKLCFMSAKVLSKNELLFVCNKNKEGKSSVLSWLNIR